MTSHRSYEGPEPTRIGARVARPGGSGARAQERIPPEGCRSGRHGHPGRVGHMQLGPGGHHRMVPVRPLQVRPAEGRQKLFS